MLTGGFEDSMMKSRLFPVITATVALLVAFCIGFLFYLSRNSQPVDPGEAEELGEIHESNLRAMQQGLEDRVAGAMTSAQQERMQSPLGLAMFRKCMEWTEFNDNHPGETAALNERQACTEYRQYVTSGITPD